MLQDDSVEVAVIGTKGTENIKKRTEGMETIDACAKAKLVQFVDVPEATISEAVSATENIFTANPNVKVILVVGDSGAQGVAEAMAAYAPDNLDEYAVFSGDVSPDTQELLPKCEAGAYRGAVAIGGSLDDLMQSTYEIMKGMISGGDYPAETLDPLTTFRCEPTPGEGAAKPPAPEFIELGGSIPLTGNFGSLGNMVLPGYEYAVEDINADGGVYVEEYGTKIPLRLTYYDDESDPNQGGQQTGDPLLRTKCDGLPGRCWQLYARGCISHRRKEPGPLLRHRLRAQPDPPAGLQVPVLTVPQISATGKGYL